MTPYEQLLDSLAVSGIFDTEEINKIAAERNITLEITLPVTTVPTVDEPIIPTETVTPEVI